ncbi:hypothetical protein FQA39_LY11866 [Lamprigera yunnana]|nr:hypothetical protein FQA39_LY11866 [Lamprigera yunnana]
MKIFRRSKQYAIFKEEERIQFYEQREDINKYFCTCDIMWKPRQTGSKTMTFEMIEEKKIFRIENMCGNKVCLGWEFVSEVWSLETVLSYRLSYSSASDFKHFYDDVIRAVAEMSGDANTNIYNIVNLKNPMMCVCLKDRLSKIGLQHFLDTINKYISNSDTSDEEEYKAVEQNGKGSETKKEEESKKSKGKRITTPVA